VEGETDRESGTPWGWIVAITTGLFSLGGLHLSHKKELAIERLKAENEVARTSLASELERRKDSELAHQNLVQALQSDFDKDLRLRRIIEYEKLWKLMVKLPKYPRTEPLSVSDLETLAGEFRNWYFNGGGLFLSENSREKYFDFQEGAKIVFQKLCGEWRPNSPDVVNAAWLRTYLERGKSWTPPREIVELVKHPLEAKPDTLPPTIVSQLRLLASSLRSSMAQDVLTRQNSVLAQDTERTSN
jgi:hypothetical protein